MAFPDAVTGVLVLSPCYWMWPSPLLCKANAEKPGGRAWVATCLLRVLAILPPPHGGSRGLLQNSMDV